MRPFTLALAAAVALASASTASADSFTPASSTFTLAGYVEFDNLIVCAATFTIETNAAGTDAKVIAATSTGGMHCLARTFTNLPWDIDVAGPFIPGVPANFLMIKGVRITHILGYSCGPRDIWVNWDPGPIPTLAIPSGTVIAPPSSTCLLEGSLDQASGPPWLAITY